MFSILKNKTNLAILFVLVVIFVVYFMYFRGDTSNEVFVKNPTTSAQKVGFEFVSLLSQLKKISFDGQIFNDAVFNSLVDLSTPIPKQPIQRNNPFAPIGFDSSSVSTTTKK